MEEEKVLTIDEVAAGVINPLQSNALNATLNSLFPNAAPSFSVSYTLKNPIPTRSAAVTSCHNSQNDHNYISHSQYSTSSSSSSSAHKPWNDFNNSDDNDSLIATEAIVSMLQEGTDIRLHLLFIISINLYLHFFNYLH